jgi:hypothetical protein
VIEGEKLPPTKLYELLLARRLHRRVQGLLGKMTIARSAAAGAQTRDNTAEERKGLVAVSAVGAAKRHHFGKIDSRCTPINRILSRDGIERFLKAYESLGEDRAKLRLKLREYSQL